ncbi:MAG: type 4a pilus biogenesis protein PilO [Planctomycetota bacterium]
MTLRGRTGAVLGAAIVASAALAALSVHLQVSRIGPARDRVEVLRGALERERAAAARRGPLEAEKAGLEARRAEFEAMLPADGADLDALRRALTDAAAKAGVLVTALRPAPAAPAPAAVEEITVAIEARGDFASLGRFLEAVESIPRAVTVEQFELRPDGIVEAEPRPETVGATLSLRMTAWRVREDGR